MPESGYISHTHPSCSSNRQFRQRKLGVTFSLKELVQIELCWRLKTKFLWKSFDVEMNEWVLNYRNVCPLHFKSQDLLLPTTLMLDDEIIVVTSLLPVSSVWYLGSKTRPDQNRKGVNFNNQCCRFSTCVIPKQSFIKCVLWAQIRTLTIRQCNAVLQIWILIYKKVDRSRPRVNWNLPPNQLCPVTNIYCLCKCWCCKMHFTNLLEEIDRLNFFVVLGWRMHLTLISINYSWPLKLFER